MPSTATQRARVKFHGKPTRAKDDALLARLGLAPVKSAESCRWFLRCTRAAVTSVAHPILGPVPCCAKCAAFASS